jgi:hypothetical protein
MKKLLVLVAIIATFANATQAQRTVIMQANPFEYAVIVDIDTSNIAGDLPCIGLTGSDKWATYQLFVMKDQKDLQAIGEPIVGTGNTLHFSLPEQRHNITCMVKASTGCGDSWMKGKVTTHDIETSMQNYRASKANSTAPRMVGRFQPASTTPSDDGWDISACNIIDGVEDETLIIGFVILLLVGAFFLLILLWISNRKLKFYIEIKNVIDRREVLKQEKEARLSSDEQKRVENGYCVHCYTADTVTGKFNEEKKHAEHICSRCGSVYYQYDGHGAFYQQPTKTT